ncbi:MAG: SDR family oxidoreductase [Nitrospirae bacterium]|nr:SDR family oxidoreductase [Nitrospirota bacterium]
MTRMLPESGTKYSCEFHVSEERVIRFGEFSGDLNPIHISREEAKSYGFARPVAHGAILLAELSRIIGTEMPGHGALWSDLQVQFKNPVFLGDKVRIELEVLQSSIAAGMVKLGINIFKGKDIVLSGSCRVTCLEKLPRRYPMVNLKEQVAVVTGGSRGLGLAITKRLLKEGIKVAMLSRNLSEDAVTVLKEYQNNEVAHFAVDITKREDVGNVLEQVFRQIGHVSIVVHAASAPVSETPLNMGLYDTLDLHWQVYVHGLLNIVIPTIGHMKEIKYGRIITIGTSFMFGVPQKHMTAYITAKNALWGLTKSLSIELAPFGITANMISPSMMVTDLTSKVSNQAKLAEARKNPSGRLVEPEEVAEMVAFLCGEGGAFVNGTNIPVTGGLV